MKKSDPDKTIDSCNKTGCISEPCYGRYCETKDCYGDKCKAGNCYGEKCKAGDCYGKQCIAGDCYGHGCVPGKCHDPNCKKSLTCDPIFRNCTDGKQVKLKRPFYWDFTRHLPEGTFLNPPLCDHIMRVKDIIDGRMEGLNLRSVHILNKNTVPYKSILNPNFDEINGVDENDIITATVPPVFKNGMCNYCINMNGIIKCSKNNELRL